MTTPNAAQLIAALQAVEDKIDQQNGVLRNLKAEKDGIVEAIEQLMDAQGTTIIAAGGLLCERKDEDVPQIQSWDELERFVLRHKRLDLFQRRLSPNVWKELVDQRGTAVPGVGIFTKRKLSVRKH